MSCEVCAGPPLEMDAGCVFCRSPLREGDDPSGLLDYLAGRLPQADVRRAGLLRRGPVKYLRLAAGGGQFRGRLRRQGLELRPELDEVTWVDRLISGLSRDAASDAQTRSALTRAGWALR